MTITTSSGGNVWSRLDSTAAVSASHRSEVYAQMTTEMLIGPRASPTDGEIGRARARERVPPCPPENGERTLLGSMCGSNTHRTVRGSFWVVPLHSLETPASNPQ